MSFDWTRFGEKVQTPRTAGSVVLGAALVVAGIALGWSDAVRIAQAIVQSNVSLGVLVPVLVLLLGAVFAVGFSAAFLLITGLAAGFRWSTEFRTRRHTENAARVDAERAQSEVRNAMSTHLRHLPGNERQLLESFLDRASDSPDGLATLSESQALKALIRKGFLMPVAVVDDHRNLYRFAPGAAEVVQPDTTSRRLASIRKALETANAPTTTLLRLFGEAAPSVDQPRHVMLDYAVYTAIEPLVAAHVLRRETPKFADIRFGLTPAHYDAMGAVVDIPTKLILTSEAVPILEETFLKAPVRRTVVELDTKLIKGSGASGSGAGGATR